VAHHRSQPRRTGKGSGATSGCQDNYGFRSDYGILS
jgi:hypothetical protein